MRHISRSILFSLVLSLLLTPQGAWAQTASRDANAFITRWLCKEKEKIYVPLVGRYLYSWEKADGTVIKKGVEEVQDGSYLTLQAMEGGEYILKAGRGVKYLRFGYWNEAEGHFESGNQYMVNTSGILLMVEQWGDIKWTSFAGAFYGCEYMEIAPNAGEPDLSMVQSMEAAFSGCASLNTPMESWNVSMVTNMKEMFVSCTSFNQPLDTWDVSKVRNMRNMFFGCSAFNQPLAGWNVSNVTNMKAMFAQCTTFNQPLDRWNVSNVTDMGFMFEDCSSFNQHLGSWNVSNVRDMTSMFSRCTAFNRPLNNWHVSKVRKMMMFNKCSSFNQSMFWVNFETVEELDLDDCGLDVKNYSEMIYANSVTREVRYGVKIYANGLRYNEEARKARMKLIHEKGWSFIGDKPE